MTDLKRLKELKRAIIQTGNSECLNWLYPTFDKYFGLEIYQLSPRSKKDCELMKYMLATAHDTIAKENNTECILTNKELLNYYFGVTINPYQD